MQFDDIQNPSGCAHFIISVTSPYLLIARAVFAKAFSVQNFTGYIYMEAILLKRNKSIMSPMYSML